MSRMLVVEILKRTWKEVRKERNEAKAAKDLVLLTISELEKTCKKLKKARETLSDIYKMLPEKERQDYVQKTIDLLYNRSGIKPCAYYFYDKLKTDLSLEYRINQIEFMWKRGMWKEVKTHSERLMNEIREDIETWKKNTAA